MLSGEIDASHNVVKMVNKRKYFRISGLRLVLIMGFIAEKPEPKNILESVATHQTPVKVLRIPSTFPPVIRQF